MENDKPRVSIGMPVYNGEKYLCEVIDSVLNQTFSDFELIISDNGSNDRTEEICRSYVARDPRVRFYRNEENRGASWNFNRVFELAKGDYFKWAAADDLCEPNFLLRCVEMLDTDLSVVIAHPQSKFINNVGNVVNIPDPGWNLQMKSPVERFRYVMRSIYDRKCNVIFGLIRASVLHKTRLMGNYCGQDYRLIGELSLHGKFFQIPEYLFLVRSHTESSGYQGLNFYKPGKSKNILNLLHWNCSFFLLILDYFIAIIHAQLHIAEKLYLAGNILYYAAIGRIYAFITPILGKQKYSLYPKGGAK